MNGLINGRIGRSMAMVPGIDESMLVNLMEPRWNEQSLVRWRSRIDGSIDWYRINYRIVKTAQKVLLNLIQLILGEFFERFYVVKVRVNH